MKESSLRTFLHFVYYQRYDFLSIAVYLLYVNLLDCSVSHLHEMYALGGRLYVATTEVEMLCIEDSVVTRNFSCLPTK